MVESTLDATRNTFECRGVKFHWTPESFDPSCSTTTTTTIGSSPPDGASRQRQRHRRNEQQQTNGPPAARTVPKESVPAYSLSQHSSSSKILRISVEGGVETDGEEVMQRIRDVLLASPQGLPRVLDLDASDADDDVLETDRSVMVKKEQGEQRPVKSGTAAADDVDKQRATSTSGAPSSAAKAKKRKSGLSATEPHRLVSLEYQKPRGDEVCFGKTPSDVRFVGHRCLGTLLVSSVSPEEGREDLRGQHELGKDTETLDGDRWGRPLRERRGAGQDRRMEEGSSWQNELSFLSWHLQAPPGGDVSGILQFSANPSHQ